MSLVGLLRGCVHKGYVGISREGIKKGIGDRRVGNMFYQTYSHNVPTSSSLSSDPLSADSDGV